MAGLFYLTASLAALFFWKTPQLCTTEACLSLPGLLGRSWYLWGALFYAVAGFLCLRFPKNRGTGAFLASGAVFHAGLIRYGYAVTGGVCPICWKFAAMGTLLAVSYWALPDRKPAWASYVSGGPARALTVAVLALLLVNPQVKQTLSVPSGSVAETTKQEKLQIFPTAEAATCILQVTVPDGNQTCLDLSKKPALFIAVWCPHCDEALRDAAEMEPEKRPYLVVTYLRDGDAEKAKGKLAGNGLGGEVYYLKQKPPAEVQGVPAMTWWDGELKYVEGAEAIRKQLHSPKLL